MTPVLQGFTGHIPAALAKKNPDMKVTSLKWIDFPETIVLDWEDPLFTNIGKDFINEIKKEYGTDHLYAIDQFIEMNPLNGDTAYLRNMSRTIINYVTEADPEGKWVIQTWPFKELTYWNKERTHAYFSGVPDDKMIALELMGESWHLTGWYKHDGWYGKPWVWSIISNFGDNVSMFGGLSQIAGNYKNALENPDKGNLSGIGLMMEGLDYNPVTYKLVTGMMWENDLPDIFDWKQNYLRSRYGILNKEIMDAWDPVFNHYYSLKGEDRSGLFEKNPVIERPNLVLGDIIPSESAIRGTAGLLALSDDLGNIDAYRYDLVNLFRQVFGQYAGHLLFSITSAYLNHDLNTFNASVDKFNAVAHDIENLMGTREEFLFGKWVSDSRERATNDEELKLYEWNARAIITTWGGEALYGYAIKDWAGLYTSYYLPKWDMFFTELRKEIISGEKLNYNKFLIALKEWELKWNSSTGEQLCSGPKGDPITIAREMWQKYSSSLLLFENAELKDK
jgi:alpha-N-acetylglucosaminidase